VSKSLTETPTDEAPDTGSAEPVTTTGSATTRVLGLVVLAGVALLVWLALVGTPAEETLGETVRLMYVHVPVVVAAYVGCLVTTVASAVWLWRRTEWWDLVAASAAEVATVFCGLTLVTGMIWGAPTWGTPWVWDARLTSTLVLFLLLLGYLALRRATVEPERRARRAAVVGLLLLPNMIVVNRSVEWWRSLHQDSTILRADLDFRSSDLIMFTTVFGITVALGLFVWLVIHRFRVAWLEQRAEDLLLADAVVERRRTDGSAPATGDAGDAGGGS